MATVGHIEEVPFAVAALTKQGPYVVTVVVVVADS